MGCALDGIWSSCGHDIYQGGGLGHVVPRRPASDIGPVLDCPSFRCGLNRRPVVSRPLARRGAADPTSLREGRPAVCAG